mmetsp:Transcript_26786/g.63538  ORF Transcript_26786/g.63538 Transcript_26786/m.63538 type:complete len:571 (-) Transcript_26786:235-1947(-)
MPPVRLRGHQVLLLQQLQHPAAALLLQGMPAVLDSGWDAEERARRGRAPQQGLQVKGGQGIRACLRPARHAEPPRPDARRRQRVCAQPARALGPGRGGAAGGGVGLRARPPPRRRRRTRARGRSGAQPRLCSVGGGHLQRELDEQLPQQPQAEGARRYRRRGGPLLRRGGGRRAAPQDPPPQLGRGRGHGLRGDARVHPAGRRHGAARPSVLRARRPPGLPGAPHARPARAGHGRGLGDGPLRLRAGPAAPEQRGRVARRPQPGRGGRLPGGLPGGRGRAAAGLLARHLAVALRPVGQQRSRRVGGGGGGGVPRRHRQLLAASRGSCVGPPRSWGRPDGGALDARRRPSHRPGHAVRHARRRCRGGCGRGGLRAGGDGWLPGGRRAVGGRLAGDGPPGAPARAREPLGRGAGRGTGKGPGDPGAAGGGVALRGGSAGTRQPAVGMTPRRLGGGGGGSSSSVPRRARAPPPAALFLEALAAVFPCARCGHPMDPLPGPHPCPDPSLTEPRAPTPSLPTPQTPFLPLPQPQRQGLLTSGGGRQGRSRPRKGPEALRLAHVLRARLEGFQIGL